MSGSSQVVVVTGASAGIGRATAVAFGERGARVALLARGGEVMDPQCLSDDRPDGHARVERRIRILEDELHVLAQSAHFAARQRQRRQRLSW